MILIRKYDEDCAIQWKGDNFDKIQDFLPRGHSVEQIDLMTLIIDLKQEVFMEDWILIQEVVINNELVNIVGVCNTDVLHELFDTSIK